ncbi:hypothetical protein Tco_1199952 [Tanacetum coccineum]
MSCLTDGVNVEANLRGPLGLNKWASNFKVFWFSMAPPKLAPSYPSLRTVVPASTSLFCPLTPVDDSGPGITIDIPASPEYMSGLDHASLAKIVSCVVSFGSNEEDYTSSIVQGYLACVFCPLGRRVCAFICEWTFDFKKHHREYIPEF